MPELRLQRAPSTEFAYTTADDSAHEHLALAGLVADLVEIAGAGVVIVIGDAQLPELLLVAVLIMCT